MAIVSNCPGLSEDVVGVINKAGQADGRAKIFGDAVAAAHGDLTQLVVEVAGGSPSDVADFQRLHPEAVPILFGAASAVAAGDAKLTLTLVDDGPVVSVVQDSGTITVAVHIVRDPAHD